MKFWPVLAGIVMGVSSLLCIQEDSTAQRVKRTAPISKYTFAFRSTQLAGTGRNVKLIVRGLDVIKYNAEPTIEALGITLEAAGVGKRKVLSRRRVGGGYYWFRASLFRHRKSKDLLLAIEVNGGQFCHRDIYYISPGDLKAHVITDLTGIFQGDPSRLAAGIVTEFVPAHYVAKADWPAGVEDNSPTLVRVCRYQSKTHHFRAGRFRRYP